MANVVKRSDLSVIIKSVNTPSYPPETWLINPNLSGLYNWGTGEFLVPVYYWKLVGDDVVEMDSGEKAVVDAQRLVDAKAARKTWLNERGTAYTDERYLVSEQSELRILYTDALSCRPRRAVYIQPWVNWLDEINEEVKAKQASVDLQSTIDAVNAVVLDEATLTSHDPLISVDGANAITDDGSLSLRTLLNENSVVTDPVTDIEGPFYLMQILEQRKDLYNDSENPLYEAGYTPILGFSGYLVEHANRILNLETIHGKIGWHNQQVIKATYARPRDLLVYYGYPNSFNSGTNQWYNEKVAQDMAKYGMIVLGDGVEDPTHPDYANSQVIIPRVKVLNPSCLVFGYVAAAQTLANFKTKADQWDTLQVHGIFLDEAGYDYGKTRAELNEMVDYVHSKAYAKLAFANVWNTDHLIGTANDSTYPNSTYNSGLVASKLGTDDWVLLESFPINTTAYTESGYEGYESKSDWLVRGQKAANLRYVYGVNFAGVGIINNANAAGQALFEFGYNSAMMWSLEAFGTSDASYASGSVTVTWWSRPDVSKMGVAYALAPSVSVDALDADRYWRFLENGKFLLDFSQSAQASSITKF